MISVVLNASALLTMIKAEPGGDRVADVMIEAWIGAINYAEVVSDFDFNGTPPDEIEAMLRPLAVGGGQCRPRASDTGRRTSFADCGSWAVAG